MNAADWMLCILSSIGRGIQANNLSITSHLGLDWWENMFHHNPPEHRAASFADCWKYAKGHMFTIGKKLQGGGVWLQGVQDSVIYGTTPKENPQSWLGAKGFCYSEDKYHGRVLFTREQLRLVCWSEVYYVHHRNIIMMTTKWVYNIEQFLVLILLLIWKFNSIFLWFGCITKSHWHHSLDPQAFQLWHYSDATSSS